MQFIVSSDEARSSAIPPDEIKVVNSKYQIWYYNSDNIPPLTIDNYSYVNVPKCLKICGNLDDTGIINIQNQPNLMLKGQGVLVAIIDTGINYKDSTFTDEYGNSRILFYYDEESETEYTNTDIDNAQEGDLPGDENGHGTFLASVVCGKADPANAFTGAVPAAKLIVYKLKVAERELREFFFVPEDEEGVYSESDLMLGISYCVRKAEELDMPLVICLGMGSNNGSHNGTEYLCDYMDMVASELRYAVVIPVGNEAVAKHHYRGIVRNIIEPELVEINLDRDSEGFYVESWSLAPEMIGVSVQSPTGEIWPKGTPVVGENNEHVFVFENTRVQIEYRYTGRRTRDELVFIRFIRPAKGIWTLRVYPVYSITGEFDMWLPAKGLLKEDVTFIRSDPNITLTMPSDSLAPMSVGGYNNDNDSVYLESGRGYDSTGEYKPDFLAPAVGIRGKGIRGDYVTFSGTSAAAAISAGAAAQAMQWMVYERNISSVSNADIKNFITRGCVIKDGQQYPSKTEGYGFLNIYNSFQKLF